MQIKSIKPGNWYETNLGIGECKRVGGTFPPSVQIVIHAPVPYGLRNFAPRDVVREVSGPSIPLGTRVRFTVDNLGAATGDMIARGVAKCVEESFGIGDEGIVAFPHPNRDACAAWVHVEVASKTHPGMTLYVGVTPEMVEVLS